MAQPDLLALYDRFRDRLASEADETSYNAVLSATDYVAGWCSSAEALYSHSEPVG
jgi:hypothetical protein